jgi:hypothetical protein
MSGDRKQQKIAKRKIKSKLKQKQARQAHTSSIDMQYIRDTLKNPIAECVIDNSNAHHGMRHLMASKMSGLNIVVLGAFLIDTFCLGVKDAFIKPGSVDKYKDNREKRPFEKIKPKDAKKLLFDAVEWSRSIGFEPHKDYKKVLKILDGVDAQASKAIYEFGENGKPYFVAGPYDSPAKCTKVLNTLQKNCGSEKDSFHYIMPSFDSDIHEPA